MADALVRSVVLKREGVADFTTYPFSIPAIRDLEELALDPAVTFFVGENGSGKSTLVEAIAIAAKLNPEGGSRFTRLSTSNSQSALHRHVRLVRGTRRLRDGYFLRAESSRARSWTTATRSSITSSRTRPVRRSRATPRCARRRP